MGGLGDGRSLRGGRGCGQPVEIRLVAAIDGVDRVVDRAMDHRQVQGASGGPWPSPGVGGVVTGGVGLITLMALLVPDENHVGRLGGRDGRRRDQRRHRHDDERAEIRRATDGPWMIVPWIAP